MAVENTQVINAFNALRDEIKKMNANFETVISIMGSLVTVAQEVSTLKQSIDNLEISVDDLKRNFK